MLCCSNVFSQCTENLYNITLDTGLAQMVSKVAYFDFDMNGVKLLNNVSGDSYDCTISSKGIIASPPFSC